MNPFLDEAVRLALEGMRSGQGGPFGAVVVCGSDIVGRGANRVLATLDPTAHAEVVAIREAASRLGRFKLIDCEIYATCEPCPMCLGAIYWAGLSRLWFVATRTEAAAAGFDDDLIYRELGRSWGDRSIPTRRIEDPRPALAFEEWKRKPDKVTY